MIEPGTVTACGPCRSQPPQRSTTSRSSAAGARPLPFMAETDWSVGAVEEAEAVAADAGRGRLDHGQRSGGCDGGVGSVAAPRAACATRPATPAVGWSRTIPLRESTGERRDSKRKGCSGRLVMVDSLGAAHGRPARAGMVVHFWATGPRDDLDEGWSRRSARKNTQRPRGGDRFVRAVRRRHGWSLPRLPGSSRVMPKCFSARAISSSVSGEPF